MKVNQAANLWANIILTFNTIKLQKKIDYYNQR